MIIKKIEPRFEISATEKEMAFLRDLIEEYFNNRDVLKLVYWRPSPVPSDIYTVIQSVQ